MSATDTRLDTHLPITTDGTDRNAETIDLADVTPRVLCRMTGFDCYLMTQRPDWAAFREGVDEAAWYSTCTEEEATRYAVVHAIVGGSDWYRRISVES